MWGTSLTVVRDTPPISHVHLVRVYRLRFNRNAKSIYETITNQPGTSNEWIHVYQRWRAFEPCGHVAKVVYRLVRSGTLAPGPTPWRIYSAQSF